MVVLSIPPLSCWQNLPHHLRAPPLLARLLRGLARLLFLLSGIVEDPLRYCDPVSSSWASCRGVVHAVEEVEEGGVGDGLWVEGGLDGFGVGVVLAMRLLRFVLWGSSRPVEPEHTLR